VKLWSTNQSGSVATIESRANICSVKFNPASFRIAFGSAGLSVFVGLLFVCLSVSPFGADHHVHYYDLRRVREPLCVFRGHRKAVSHVKFISADELVSACVLCARSDTA
jgi:E3 ubiquitin-protein ligase RFWD2